jgi:hypothetical protein
MMFLAAGPVWFQQSPAGAASATATFHVTARVVKSCQVSPASLAGQAANSNGTLSVNCGAGAEPTNSQTAAMSGGPASPSANVTYGVSELPGADGALTIITINF